jgi:hypothetical protein
MKKLFIGFLSLLNFKSVAQVIDDYNPNDTSVEETSFVIYDNVQSKYIGTYRDGKCYNGYFKTTYQEYEVSLVDYYEMGVLKFQYSKKFDPENYEYKKVQTLDTKSFFKDGAIFNGIEYAFIKRGLVCKEIKKGSVETFEVHMFAMHYYNRFNFERKDSTIRITNTLEEGDEIKYIYSKNILTSEHSGVDGTMRLSEYQKVDVFHLPKSSMVYYIKFGNKMLCKSTIEFNEEDEIQRFFVNIRMFGKLKMPETGTSKSGFSFLVDYFSKPDALENIFYANNKQDVSETESAESENQEGEVEYLIAIMDTDAKGKIINGYSWVDASIPFYEEYRNGKLTKKENLDIQNFQELGQSYYNKRSVVTKDY